MKLQDAVNNYNSFREQNATCLGKIYPSQFTPYYGRFWLWNPDSLLEAVNLGDSLVTLAEGKENTYYQDDEGVDGCWQEYDNSRLGKKLKTNPEHFGELYIARHGNHVSGDSLLHECIHGGQAFTRLVQKHSLKLSRNDKYFYNTEAEAYSSTRLFREACILLQKRNIPLKWETHLIDNPVLKNLLPVSIPTNLGVCFQA